MKILKVLILIYYLLEIFVLFFADVYIFELIISFFPYLILLNLLIFVVFFVLYFVDRKKINFVIFLISFVFVVLGLYKIFSFYSYDNNISLESKNIKILYANIYKNNFDIENIKRLVNRNNPDICMFVEFSREHYNQLHNFFMSKYGYINRNNWSNKYAGSIVFSKYPLENHADSLNLGGWKFGYFSLNFSGENIDMYLVHTSSPTSKESFQMRNSQLEKFISMVNKKENNILVIGDFNISPWSVYYKFIKSLGFENFTSQNGLIGTWKLGILPIWVHIDYILHTGGLQLANLQLIDILGSDHVGYLFNLGINKKN